jgi:hemerythrin-like domain-containing protein
MLYWFSSTAQALCRLITRRGLRIFKAARTPARGRQAARGETGDDMLAARFVHTALLAEHSALRQALATLDQFATHARETGRVADPECLRGVLDFLQYFPEKTHRAKDQRQLFRLLRNKTPEAEPLLTEVVREQETAQAFLSHVRELALGADTPQGLEAFSSAVRRYREILLGNLQREADEVFALAWRKLDPEDWFAIAVAFTEIRYPTTSMYEPAAATPSAPPPSSYRNERFQQAALH